MTGDWDSAVIGMGKTGASCARYRSAQGSSVVALDSRLDPPCGGEIRALPGVSCHLGGFPVEILSRAEELIFSPGVNPQAPEFQLPELREIPVTGDIQLFAEAREKLPEPGLLVMVTGTNGKSTIANLTRFLLKEAGFQTALGGNFGTPALDLLQLPDVQCWVLELSSFQLQLVDSVAADIVMIANLAPDHLDRHGSFSRYLEIKRKIFKGARSCIFDRQTPLTKPPSEYDCRLVGIGRDAPVPGKAGYEFGMLGSGAEALLAHQSGWTFPLRDLPLAGGHNLINTLYAVAAAFEAGAPLSEVSLALARAPSLEHRFEVVAQRAGVTFVDDSKATNVAATEAALSETSVDGAILLLAGGQGKKADFGPLARAARGKVGHAALYGQDRLLLAAALEQESISYSCHENLEEAFANLAQLVARGDLLLLSPACASLDQFPSYQARGLAFQRLIKQWSGQ